MTHIITIFKRELVGYFATPIAYVFLAIFVFLSGIFTFYLGSFFERGQADLQPFFQFHPWLYLFLIPALAMRLWAEERRGGTIELLLTLPVTVTQAVLGKFLAAWAFSAIALALTFPIWITVNYLGDPDNGVILAGYVGSLLMAGAFLAIGACVSALTRNQVIAFVVSAVVCLGFVMSGFPLVLEFFSAWAPDFLVQAVSSFSFLSHFNAINEGVIELRDIVYFVSLIVFWLFVNAVVIDLKKAS
ncbi:MAG: ABC transporter permease [Gammaproteobacteria bacterium]|nr:ABC transporter permease [Gammaproteobacteria bacterium]NIN37814.1 ABC transporter permease [Gammaproteobacteria bacterium]NIO23474.1 ABC transporter permease [Gammaproteobacteria bacterium]NIO64090.1 ABC transporter permease [Gammaproteobacteria bacterium]NIP47047.1 ABC transporter permease [Gammaproteobacteria bacterium]